MISEPHDGCMFDFIKKLGSFFEFALILFFLLKQNRIGRKDSLLAVSDI